MVVIICYYNDGDNDDDGIPYEGRGDGDSVMRLGRGHHPQQPLYSDRRPLGVFGISSTR